jgi:lipopolysaccharide transport system permease protein
MLSIFYLVFEIFLNRGGDGFATFLIIGIVNWLWFSNSISNSMLSIEQAKGVMHRIYLPKYLIPMVPYLVGCTKQVIVFLLVAIYLIINLEASTSWLYIPVIILTQFLLNLALVLLISSIIPFFPDLQNLVPPILQALMFCSGIFYPMEIMSSSLQEIFLLNPIANLIAQYRSVLIDGNLPDFEALLFIAAFSLLLIAAMVYFYRKMDKYYPRIVI